MFVYNAIVLHLVPRQRLLLLVLILVFSLMPLSAAGQQVAAGSTMARAFKYYMGRGVPKDYARALRLYLQSAGKGNAEAQFIVGGMYYRGQGTDPDPVKAVTWLLKAEQQGRFSPESLAVIGTMYLQGTGVPQNYQKAESYLRRASELGDAMARKNLAYMLYNGLGRPPRYEEALELYTRAAMAGDSAAQYNVGLMYENGLGTDPDPVAAYSWYSLSASGGNMGAISARNRLTARMSFEELNKAQLMAVRLFGQVHGVDIVPGEDREEPGPES